MLTDLRAIIVMWLLNAARVVAPDGGMKMRIAQAMVYVCDEMVERHKEVRRQ